MNELTHITENTSSFKWLTQESLSHIFTDKSSVSKNQSNIGSARFRQYLVSQLGGGCNGKMVALRLEAVLVGCPGDGVGNAVVADEGVGAAHHGADLLADLLGLAGDVGGGAVAGLVAVLEGAVLVLGVVHAHDGHLRAILGTSSGHGQQGGEHNLKREQ